MKRNREEDKLQADVFDHVRRRKAPGAVIWSNLNGAYFGPDGSKVGARYKRMGAKKGLPDIMAFHGSKFYGLELKVAGNYPTAEQTACLKELQDQGAIVAVATGLDAALGYLERWGLLTGYQVRTTHRPIGQPKPCPPSIYDDEYWVNMGG